VTESIYQNLVRAVDADAPESVHHTDWPEADKVLVDEQLLVDMDLARAVVSLGHADRVAANVKVRQPLSRIRVVAAGKAASLERFADVIADELNVKSVELAEGEAELVTYRILPVNRILGPRFGRAFPAVRKALAELDPYQVATTVAAGHPVTIAPEGEPIELAADEVLVQAEPKPGFQVNNDPQRGIVVALDTTVSPALKAEGLAREVVRRIQQMRKDASFDLSDRINTTYRTEDAELAQAIEAHSGYIKQETLSLTLEAGEPISEAYREAATVNGVSVTLGISRTG
jgi:isoleucyl-tRNA synthetase